MAKEFKLPELGENVASGDLVRLMVKPGDTVGEGQPVIELETDKAVIEVPSSVSGTVQEVRAKQGEKLKVGQVIFTYDSANGTQAPSQAAQPEKREEKPQVAPKQEATRKAEAAVAPAAAAPAASGGQRLEFKLPELGENVANGQLVRIIANIGTSVTEGQPLLELETDKAVVEVPSTFSGTIREVHVKEGDRINVGQLIFVADAQPAGAKQTPAAPKAPAPAAEERRDHSPGAAQLARMEFAHALRAEGKTEREAHPPDVGPLATRAQYTAPAPGRAVIPASPTVRRLAREIGVDIAQVRGTGPGGRISEEDVKGYAKYLLQGRAAAPGRPSAAPALPDFSRWGEVEKEQMRSVRRKTAEHLANAWSTIPHVTQHDHADITQLEKLRARYAKQAEAAGGKLTMTAIALKVVAAGMKKYPKINASIDVEHEEIIYKKYVHVGIAVDTDRGLLVPVIRNVDQKSVFQLAAELTQVSAKARDKKLAPEDMEGGTFTITNLGGIGGTSFTPIVNYPEVAILGMSRSRVEPVWDGKEFVPRTMLPLSLSYDHRLIDGADAARFLRFICDVLENPALLLFQ